MFGVSSVALGNEGELIAPYFQALRDRELFGVAERYAEDRLAELPLGSSVAVELMLEWSRTLAAHGRVAVDSQEQAFLLNRAEEVLPAAEGPAADHVEIERAFRTADRAELNWWTWYAHPSSLQNRRSALSSSQLALTQINAWLGGDARRTGPRRFQAEQRAIELLLLMAEIETGEPRAELLVRAEDRLRAVRALAGDRAAADQHRLQQVRIARLRGDRNEVVQLVKQLLAGRSLLTIKQAAVAEAVQFELDSGLAVAAATRLTESRDELGEVTDRLRAQHVEAILGMASTAGDRRDQLVAVARTETGKIRGAWRLRAEWQLRRVAEELRFGPQAVPLVDRGRELYQQGDVAGAVQSFRQAAEVATTEARSELLFMAASLLVESNQFSDARLICEQVPQGQASPELSARASLLAAYCQGRIASETRAPADADDFIRRLQNHVERYPSDPTAGDAANMLASFGEQSNRPALVLEADRRMPDDHPKRALLRERSVRVALQVLANLRQSAREGFDGQSRAWWEAEAIRLADSLRSGKSADALENAKSRMMAVRLQSLLSHPDYGSILQQLDQLPRPGSGETGSAEWGQLQEEAQALKLICLTGLGRFSEAATILEGMQNVSVTELIEVLQRLTLASQSLAGKSRLELARLQLSAIRRIRLQGGELAPQSLQMMLECEAEALVTLGQFAEAVRLYSQVVAERPQLRERYARVLGQTGNRDDLARARGVWQELESARKQGSAGWFEARAELAAVMLALGEKQEARKLLSTTSILYPDGGGNEVRARLELLRQQADRP